MAGRTLAIGDIHGCDVALGVLLEKLQPTKADTVVVLGDVVDRGPNTRRAVDLLIDLQRSCRLVFIMGNHEEMMLDALRSRDMYFWLSVGGRQTLLSYGDETADVPANHLEFLAAGVAWHETDDDIFVHAFLEPHVELDKQSPEWLRWYKIDGTEPRPHPTKRVVCGHTSQKSGKPILGDGWICIDTYAWGDGWLTCLDVGRNLLYQSKQNGQYRGEIPPDAAAL